MTSSTLKNLTFYLAVLTVILPGVAAGQNYSAFDFLRVSMNARAAALGNSSVTLTEDPSTFFSNPSAISTLETPSASVGFLKHLLDVNAGYVAYGQEIEDIGWFEAGIIYFNYGSFDKKDKFGNSIGSGTFGASDLAFSLGYGNRSENLYYGFSLKYIYKHIDDYNASGIAMDAGVTYTIPSEDMVLGLSILNAGTQISSSSAENEDMPLDVKLGVSKKLEHLPLNFLLNFHKLNETEGNFFDRFSSFSLGGEFLLSKVFTARIGYYNEWRKELKIGNSAKLAGFSAGFGIDISDYILDYSFSSMGEIGSWHRFSLSTVFGN